MQSSSPAAALPSAQVIGNAFVEQYYHVLHRSPELVYKFYQDSSILSRPEPDGTMTSVATMQAINEKMQSMDYKNYKAEIKTADAQDSYQEGVMVLVTGCLTGTDNVKRKFTQTFFLAPQEKGYFVLNDIFRYVDVEEKEASETTAFFVNGTIDIPVGVPSTSDPEPTLVADNAAFNSAPAPEAEDVQNGAEICDPSDIEEGSVLEEEVIQELPSKSQDEMVTIAVSDLSAAQEEKISYASIVRVPKSTARSTTVYIPTSNARAAPTNANQQAHVSEKAYPNAQGSAYSVDGTPGSSNIQEEGYSIYVRNLPMNATAQQLEQEFKKFGSIKHDGIQVRSNKQGFCFGFVEFESLESMQKAITASTISIGGRQAAVEEKRTNTRVGSSGRGRYPPGRGGGFRGDTFRGRGNFGVSRGYGRSDFRNQGEFSTRPKGSSGRGVETYQRVDQSGSGSGSGRRFSRQGSNKNGVSA